MQQKNSQGEHHIVLKKHHKIMIGGISSLVVIILILNSILLYIFYGQLELTYSKLSSEIKNLEAETNSKIGSLTESILNTRDDLTSLGAKIGSIDDEIGLLKASADSDFSGIIGEVIQSVVTIRTDVSQGTGFIIHEDGYVVTNYHVMEGASAATIITSDGERHSVKLVGHHPVLDIALLKISGNYKKIGLENSNDVSVGEKVIAIGNPLGLQFSVSEGIISAVHRKGPNDLPAYIQTDAALNPGNSGGPLINKKGKVVGINNFKIGGGENLGFALESNYLKEAVNEITQQALNQTLV